MQSSVASYPYVVQIYTNLMHFETNAKFCSEHRYY